MNQPVDITNRPDTAAVTLLCTFDNPVFTPAGRIDPKPDGFWLEREDRKPRRFAYANGAVEVLRRLTRKLSSVS